MKKVSSLDVLTLLREHKIEKKPIRVKEFFLYLGNNKFPLNTETAWKSKISDKRYDLGSLWLCLEHNEKQSTTAQYYAEVDKYKVTMVSNVDKEEIINYFTGKIEFTESINLDFSSVLKRPNKNKDPGPDKRKKIKKNDGNEESKEIIKNPLEDQAEKEKEQLRIVDFLSKIEKPIDSKNKAMRKVNKSFKFVLGLVKNLISEEPRPNPEPNNEQKSLLDEILQKGGEMLGNEGKPVILVPKFAKNGNICLSNAASFLVDGNYIEPNDEKSNANERIEISRNISKRKVVFEVRNDVLNFKQETWKRLVAVFIEGVKNEFREWPDGNKPAILFAKIKGFYMKYHDVPLSDAGNHLNVTKLNINRNKRFLDSHERDKFWEQMEKFLLNPRVSF